jgi:hypothetical protein
VKPLSNNPRLRDREITLSKRPPATEISLAIYEQEEEIESMFQNLVRFSNCADLHNIQDQPDRARDQRIAKWILIAVFAVITVIGSYLLWVKAGKDRGSHQVLCGSIAGALKSMTRLPGTRKGPAVTDSDAN